MHTNVAPTAPALVASPIATLGKFSEGGRALVTHALRTVAFHQAQPCPGYLKILLDVSRVVHSSAPTPLPPSPIPHALPPEEVQYVPSQVKNPNPSSDRRHGRKGIRSGPQSCPTAAGVACTATPGPSVADKVGNGWEWLLMC